MRGYASSTVATSEAGMATIIRAKLCFVKPKYMALRKGSSEVLSAHDSPFLAATAGYFSSVLPPRRRAPPAMGHRAATRRRAPVAGRMGARGALRPHHQRRRAPPGARARVGRTVRRPGRDANRLEHPPRRADDSAP